MSINIPRFIETTLKERTTAYSPLIEAIVNSIEAVLEANRTDGKIVITPIRSSQISYDDNMVTEKLPDVVGFIIEDNGIGFDKKNRDSFDEICTAYKINLGGKGLGRFIFLKYFKKVKYSSIYKENGKYRLREFNLGSNNDIIENEKDQETDAHDTKTILYLNEIRKPDYEKELTTIARKILKKILVFFVNDQFTCPTITLRENNTEIILNDLIKHSDEIQHVQSEKFSITGFPISEQEKCSYDFDIKVYKVTYPGSETSKLCLTAHNREVIESSLSKYIPEFKDDFYEISEKDTKKNYIILAYILGKYLDQNVSLERERFNFPAENSDMFFPISQQDIEKEASKIIEDIFKESVVSRRNKTRKTIKDYVDNFAPWYKTYISELDYSSLSYEPDEQTIDSALQKIRFRKEREARETIKQIINDPKTEIPEKVNEAIKHIQEAGSNELIHYVVLRRTVLDLLSNLLKTRSNGRPSLESEIHNLIFPMRSDSEITNYENHNLWILDEKLNFTELIMSDKAIDKEGDNRPDLFVAHKLYDKKMTYRSGSDTGNPITIFEFKQPLRDDFTNPSAKEDPIEQMIRYTIKLKETNCTTPDGRPINVNADTLVYGFIVCDLSQKVHHWLYKVKNFFPMPDRQGYYYWFSSNRLYIEVLSWDKIVNDAELRNKIFFKKLGLVQ